MSNAQFYLHHFPQQEFLADILLSKLKNEGLGDPFYKSHVLVRNQGMATWLKRRMAQQSGLAMQVEFPQPHSFLQEIIDSQSIDPEHLKWQIYETLPTLLDRPHFSSLRDYLQTSGDSRESDLKRYQLSGIISGLFDKYLLYRPQWIAAWQRGEKPSQLIHSTEESWQRELWQSLKFDPNAHWSQTLIQGDPIELPDDSLKALHVFGISNFAPIYVRFLYKLSETIPVHIYWMNPVEANGGYWEDAPNRIDWLLAKEFDDPAVLKEHNPLLSSFGRLGREFIHTLYGGSEHDYHVQEEDIPHASPIIKQPTTALQSLQSSIYNNAPAPNDSISPEDSSISIHACHTPLRELETLKTYLLTLAEKSPLDAGDVLVMCPDIASYAPAIEAVFGGEFDQSRLAYSIGDSNAPITDPTIAAVLQLFTLHTSRFSNTDALALLSTPAISRRFDLHEDDISTIKQWLMQNGIRWGFDDSHVRKIAPECPDAPWTWRDGINRMLLGYAMPNSDRSDPVLWKKMLPFHQIEGGNSHILGALCEFLDWCDDIRNQLQHQRPLQDWVELSREWIDRGFDKDDDSQQRLQVLYQTLDTILEQTSEFTDPIPVDVFTSHLSNQLETSNSPRGFLSGSVTFCEMKPMRAIPSRVLCMLGMNHDSFPRKSSDIQFDLTQNNRKMGDRSTRDDDTYSFLEALLSARESLYISYIGTSIKDGEPRPPSTAVQTLIDYVPGLAGIVETERLHAFDPWYFKADHPICHDATLLEAAKKLVEPPENDSTSERPHFTVTPPESSGSIDVESFIKVLTHPARHFLRNCLQARSIYKDNPLDENEPMEVDPLTAYGMKSTLIKKRALPKTQIEAWSQEGVLPIGALGKMAIAQHIGDLEEQLNEVPPTTPQKLSVTIGDLTITGNAPITEIDGEQKVIVINPSKDTTKTQLAAWIYQLLTSAKLESPISSQVYGIDKNKLKSQQIAPEPEYQLRLEELVDLYQSAQSSPLPHFPKTAVAYLTTKRKDESDDEYIKKQEQNALKQWVSDKNSTGESDDAAIQCLFDTKNLFTEEFLTTTKTIWSPLLEKLSK